MRAPYTMDASSAGVVAKEFAMHAAIAGVRASAVASHFGVMLLTTVRGNSSGAPGPEVETGRYLASHRLELRTDVEGAQAEVGTDLDRGYALEFGYVATDADGAVVVHQPYPHYRPAIAEIEGPFVTGVAEIAIR